MSAYFTSPFMARFPDLILENLLNDDATINSLRKAISGGRFPVEADEGTFLNVLEILKTKEPILHKHLTSLFSSSKIKTIDPSELTPAKLPGIAIRKKILQTIESAVVSATDTVCHDNLENRNQQNELITRCQKPIFIENDLVSNRIEFLFSEKSVTQNKGEKFSWSNFLHPYVLPFKTIRILDPYLYVNLGDINIGAILKTLTRQSDDGVLIQIISDLSADSKWRPDEIEEKVLNILGKMDGQKGHIELYYQLSSASDIFHKRAIWTDFWVIGIDRGFDFLKSEPIGGSVKQENYFSMAGKYASDKSLWNQVNNNWANYLENSRLIKRI